MYDLLLKHGRVIDPAQRLNRVADVAVEGGRISLVRPNVNGAEAGRVIDVKGKLVTPGLIDPHVHIYEGVTPFGIDADTVDVRAGVTTVADAGSSGPYTFGGIPKYILPKTATDLFLFVNIARVGMAMNPEIESIRDIDLDAAIQVVGENKGLVRGVKARIVSPNVDALGMEMPRMALRVARETGTRAMFHIGHRAGNYSAEFIRELLPLLAPGDIITHVYCD
ncbi:MAG: amidohydrolase/deacetylase family metallohydrolase, partial [Chloroflexota bacterium]